MFIQTYFKDKMGIINVTVAFKIIIQLTLNLKRSVKKNKEI